MKEYPFQKIILKHFLVTFIINNLRNSYSSERNNSLSRKRYTIIILMKLASVPDILIRVCKLWDLIPSRMR